MGPGPDRNVSKKSIQPSTSTKTFTETQQIKLNAENFGLNDQCVVFCHAGFSEAIKFDPPCSDMFVSGMASLRTD